MSFSLGALMVASGAAIAQTNPSTTNGGDVIIDTNPDNGSNTGSGSNTGRNGSTTGRNGSSTPSPVTTGTRFTSQLFNGQYTVMYMPENQPNQMYPWAIPSAMGGGWDPQRRSNEIARRLESYRPDGLVEMKTGFENGYNTICVTTERVPACRIVLTVPNGQDPQTTRDRVFQNLSVADSGQQTQGVFTYGSNGRDTDILGDIGKVIGIGGGRRSSSAGVTNRSGINLKPFLSPRDGGTGERLSGGLQRSTRPAATGRTPSLFRR
jgi:hypothetical protein